MDIREINRALIADFRATAGRMTGQFEGRPILLLTTAGARSARPHTAPMMYTVDGDRLLVYASNQGAPKPPDWYVNLLANPRVTVEVGPETYEATAVVTTGEERERLFAKTLVDYPFFADHEAKAGRQIPVVALIRTAV
jgi:deazaflavin-dependent oxidoreductase (nitroreductase family)